jgi:hypothetical protein
LVKIARAAIRTQLFHDDVLPPAPEDDYDEEEEKAGSEAENGNADDEYCVTMHFISIGPRNYVNLFGTEGYEIVRTLPLLSITTFPHRIDFLAYFWIWYGIFVVRTGFFWLTSVETGKLLSKK